MKENVRALVLGATGAVGSEVVRQCLSDSRFEKVFALTRRPLNVSGAKLEDIQHENFLEYENVFDKFREIDVCFCALGVSQVQVSNPKIYTTITRDFVVAAARALKTANPDSRFCFVSGAGTDATEKSSTLWRRVKGEAENRVREIYGDQLAIFRPGYIHPIVSRDKAQWQDKIWSLFYALKPIMPQLVTDTVEVARAMIAVSFEKEMPKIVSSAELKFWAGRA